MKENKVTIFPNTSNLCSFIPQNFIPPVCFHSSSSQYFLICYAFLDQRCLNMEKVLQVISDFHDREQSIFSLVPVPLPLRFFFFCTCPCIETQKMWTQIREWVLHPKVSCSMGTISCLSLHSRSICSDSVVLFHTAGYKWFLSWNSWVKPFSTFRKCSQGSGLNSLSWSVMEEIIRPYWVDLQTTEEAALPSWDVLLHTFERSLQWGTLSFIHVYVALKILLLHSNTIFVHSPSFLYACKVIKMLASSLHELYIMTMQDPQVIFSC